MSPKRNVGANIRTEAIPQSDSNPAIEDMASIQLPFLCRHQPQQGHLSDSDGVTDDPPGDDERQERPNEGRTLRMLRED